MGVLLFDQYSLLHCATGVIAYFWGFSLVFSFIAHTIFELGENTKVGIKFINENLKDIWPGGKPNADSYINILGDTFVFVIGWILAYELDAFGKLNHWY
jgi:hypothetical protein